jgi:hypothetical protein
MGVDARKRERKDEREMGLLDRIKVIKKKAKKNIRISKMKRIDERINSTGLSHLN